MFTPTGDYPNTAMPNLGVRVLNRLSHVASSKIAWLLRGWDLNKSAVMQDSPNGNCSGLLMTIRLAFGPPILCAWSPSILPASSDWPSRVHVTGYFFFPLDESYSPPNELDTFLKSDKSSVCVSFGCMVNKDAKRIDDIVVESLKETNNRGIILSGWVGVKNRSSNDLFYLESAPHDWLLPRCKMIILHGGAGTTSAGLHAGIPNIVTPFTADQPFWGNRVHVIGAGPKPIPVKKMSVDKLTYAIAEAESNVIRDRAQVIGQSIRSEYDVKDAVKLIEMYAADFYSNVGHDVKAGKKNHAIF
jgi:sterol 3beta-glucosyltransferase